jgi:uncharacterized membrane protein YfcA
MIETSLFLAIIGAIAGFLAALLGIGGGIIIVPSLNYFFVHFMGLNPAMVMHASVASSLAIMILITQSAVRAHYKLNNQIFYWFRKIWPGLLVGAIAGITLSYYLSGPMLKTVFAVFMLLTSLRMLKEEEPTPESAISFAILDGFVFVLIGLCSGLLGVGGGVIMIPYLTYKGLPLKLVIPLTGISTLFVSVFGTLFLVLTAKAVQGMPAYSTGYIYWPAVFGVALPSLFCAPIGAKLMHKVPTQWLKKIFMALLIFMAIDMLRQG